MPTLPYQFDSTPSIRLLKEAAQGLIGFDRRLIRTLLARPEETLDALEEYSESNHEDDLLDMTEQAFDLYRALGSERALPFYLRLLEGREPGEVPDELIEAIAAQGEAAVAPLLKLRAKLEEGDAHGADVVFVLAALGVRDERISALLRETLAKDPYEGALCIGLSGDPALKPDAEAALNALPRSAVEERKVLAECLESLGRDSKDEDLRQEIDILGQYPEEALPMFEQIKPQQALEFLEVEDARYRAEAAGSFLDEEYGDDVRARLMEVAQSDSSPEVRGAALRSLGERVEEPDVRALMLERLKEVSDPKERRGLLVGLAGATQLAEVHAAIVEAYQREDLRAAAVEAMWRSLDARFAPYFAEALKSADLQVKRHGVQGVGAFRLELLANDLVPLFDDEDLREDALFAYAMAAPGKTNKKGVEKLFSEIEERAGGLTGSEEETVALALDRRLQSEGLKPVFFDEETPQAKSSKVGRNDPCPCGSGKKYKKCCGA